MAKSNYEIEFHPEAIREIREAIEWYRERDEAVAGDFRSLLKSAERFGTAISGKLVRVSA